MLNTKVEEVKKQALKNAENLHRLAQETGDPNLYDKAAEYYYTTGGHNKEAFDCWDIAERLRSGEK